MLDLILDENQSLTPKLSASDRIRVDQFSQSLRDLERTLEPPARAGACNPMGLSGGPLDPYDPANHQLLGRAFQQLIGLSLACDLTRSVSFAWAGCASGRVYTNLGHSEGHHDISHNSSDEAFAQIRQIHRHLWSLSTGLYDVLKATPEGDGSVWDNTLIVHWNELGQGDVHSADDSLVVFAGGSGGYFRRGELIDFDNDVGFTELITSCFHYMGFEDVETFGDPRLSNGGVVPNILA